MNAYAQACASVIAADVKKECVASVAEQRAWVKAKAAHRRELAAALEQQKQQAMVAGDDDGQAKDGGGAGDNVDDFWRPISAAAGASAGVCERLAAAPDNAGDSARPGARWPDGVDNAAVAIAAAAATNDGRGAAAPAGALQAQLALARRLRDFVVSEDIGGDADR